MENYYNFAIISLVISSVLLFLTAVYKVSFDFMSNKDISAFNGRTKARIEKMYCNKDRLSITIIQVYAVLITVITLSWSEIFDNRLAVDDPFLLFLIKAVVISLFVLCIKNILPFLFSAAREGVVRIFSLPAYILLKLLAPLTYIFHKIRNIGFRMENGSMGSISMDELSDAVEIVSKASTPEEKRILTGMVRFVNADVSDIMCHRTDMVAINIDSSFEEVIELIDESGFSRIPVYREVLDEIVGVLYVKDLIPHMSDPLFNWKSILRKPYFVSGDRMINEILVKFQKKKIHLAIVVDEYGSTQGIVSLEDILEEIVGEIEDESDIEERFYWKLDESNYIFEGKTPLNDFADVIGMDADDLDAIRGGAETLAGLIVELRQDVPKVGSDIKIPSYELKVVKVDKYRIERIKVTKIDDNASDS